MTVETVMYRAPADPPAGSPLWMLAPELACESPIEVAFLRGLVARARVRRLTAWAAIGCETQPKRIYPVTETFETEGSLGIRCQAAVGRQRYDFLLELAGQHDSVLLVVECDGHDFHERTKEQAARDRSRDRAIQARGASVFRFTGREIWADAPHCADECIAYLVAKYTDLRSGA